MASQSLPIFMTLLGCWLLRLGRPAHGLFLHETESLTFSTTSSTDTISCSKTMNNQMGDDTADDESSQRASGMVYMS